MAGLAQARTWTNVKGSTISAKLLSVEGEEILLLLEDGRQVKINKAILSGADIDYIQEWVNSEGSLIDNEFQLKEADDKLVRIQDEWGKQWLKSVEPLDLVAVNQVATQQNDFVYESPNFIFQSEIEPTGIELSKLALRFEYGLKVLSALPLNIIVAKRPSRKFIVNLCYDEAKMDEFQGIRDFRVSFLPTSFQVLMKRDEKGKEVALNDIRPLFALTHWANQSVDRPHWFVDALSYYMKLAPEKKGAVVFDEMPQVVAKKLLKEVKSGKIKLPPLRLILDIPSNHVVADNHHLNFQDDVYHQGSVLILVYLVHNDQGKHLSKLIDYLKLSDEGKEKEGRKILLEGFDIKDFQDKLIKYWKKFGVNLQFDSE